MQFINFNSKKSSIEKEPNLPVSLKFKTGELDLEAIKLQVTRKPSELKLKANTITNDTGNTSKHKVTAFMEAKQGPKRRES